MVEAWRAILLHINAQPDPTSAIHRVFAEMDTDDSGGLDIDELCEGIRKVVGLELSPEHVEVLKQDLDDDGKIR